MEQDDPFRLEETQGGGSGLPVAALVLGAMSIPAAILAGLGIVPALAGLVIGVVAMRRSASGMALLGILLSMVGVLASAGMVALILWGYRSAMDMTTQLATTQREVNLAWQGVRSPAAKVTAEDGTTIDFRERDGRKLVIYQYFPTGGPFMDASPVEPINRLADSAAGEFDVLVLMAMPQESALALASGQGVTAPIVGAQHLPNPFQFSMGSHYFVIDRNGVIQLVFGPEATYEELYEAATGPDFEGEAASEPDLTGIDTTYYPFVPQSQN